MSEQTPEKITVNYDDLNSRKVEQRLKEQDALARNRVYAAMDETMVAPTEASAPSTLEALWRNSIFALALFGLIGGLLAWGLGTLLEFKADIRKDSVERIDGIRRLIKLTEEGTLKYDTARLSITDAVENGRGLNPHFALTVIPVDAQFRRMMLDRITVLERTKEITPEEAKSRRDKELELGRRENPDFAVMTDDSLSDKAKIQKLDTMAATREKEAETVVERESLRSFIGNVLAYGVRGVVLGMLLAIAVPLTENNIQATVVNGSVGAALGLLGGVAAAFVTSRIQGLVANSPASSTQQYLATIATWGALGIFLTLAPGIVMRNKKKLAIGLTGGLIGGLIGGVLFEPISELSFVKDYPRIPELVAMISIGLLAGLATGLIEDAAKSGWLKVSQGLIAGKQFILYRNPTYIGSSPDCQIYLFKDPKVGKRHAAIHIVPNGFDIEDMPLGVNTLVNGKAVSRTRLKNGDRIQVGSTQLVFMEKEQG
ncbi:FHA domain-containing protein [Humisphaera borealis]|uniref:FHA domain-containing protein n=1 Tax=Humisphaera borealis TaxID=2807512 RepID=A0A7M2WTN8_9BACT|nr:FHA domain-containing protein [Humisphaera borealis]QOV88813.1 FHA domain-containing protein [Humisphaera borealis]